MNNAPIIFNDAGGANAPVVPRFADAENSPSGMKGAGFERGGGTQPAVSDKKSLRRDSMSLATLTENSLCLPAELKSRQHKRQ